MSKFATKFPHVTAALNGVFGEGNAAIEFDEQNSAATLGSEHLGAINKRMGDLQSNLKEANEALAASGSQYAAEIADLKAAHNAAMEAKNEELTKVKAELATLKGETPASAATNTGEEADPAQECNKDYMAIHNRQMEELGLNEL